MSDALTYMCTGTDPARARTVLGEVLAEIRRRNEVCAEAGNPQWDGPGLHLSVDDLPQLAADADCRRVFGQVLALGRKAGVTGVARGPEVYGMPAGVDGLTRAHLSAGVPLRFEAVDVPALR